MKLKAILIAPLLAGFFIAPAYAQKTKAQLSTEITTTYPDNTTGLITPLGVRTYESDVINSIMPTAPVVSGNLACFDGITGLLKDCGTAPTTNPLIVGTTPINGGATTNVLFDNSGVLGEYGISGSGNVCMTISCVMTTPALGTPASGVATNLTGTAAGLTAGNVTTNANLTGPVTSVGNATTIGANQVSRSNLSQGAGLSVIGVTGSSTANVADIAGSANQFLGVNNAGTAVAFNTMSQDCTLATGVITCTKTNNVPFTTNATAAVGQLPGTTTNDNAASGKVGEYVESIIVSGSAVSLTTATAKTVTSISLTAGDWDVDCIVYYSLGGTTNYTDYRASLSLSTNTLDATPGRLTDTSVPANAPGALGALSQAVPAYRFSLSGTTSIFLIAQSSFTVSTMSAYGIIRARRVR